MFTGIVEVVGNVSALEPLDTSASGGNGTSLTISDCASILVDAHEGDSISINGTCLTVTTFTPSSFKVGISPETLRRTNLGQLLQGSKVNLERAVRADTRMGGHFVQGHVDTVADIVDVRPDGNARTLRLKPRDSSVLRYIVEKGYVTLDGASLTVTKVDDKNGWWEVMLIAYTQERIVTATKTAGDGVNVEVDMLGKYVEKGITGYLEGLVGDTSPGGGGTLDKLLGKMMENKLKDR